MNAGAHLSHAARLTGEAQRALLSAVLHLEAADAVMVDIDGLLAEVEIDDVDVASLLKDLGVFADNLQRVADTYGHREVRARRRAARADRGVAA